MKLGVAVSTYASQFGPIVFRDGALGDNLTTIRTLGYHGVDLFVDYRTDAQLDALRAQFDENNLEVAMYIAIFLAEQGVNLSAQDEQERLESVAAYKQQIINAQRLGSGLMPVGFLRGKRADDDPLEAYYERLAASLKELCDFAVDYDVTVCVEPINRYEINTLNSVEQSLDFITRYGLDDLGLLLDAFHMNIEDRSLTGSILAAGDKIAHFHAPDSNRYAAGTGHLDFPALVDALTQVNYAGYLTLEAFPEPDAETCASTHIEFLKQTLTMTVSQE